MPSPRVTVISNPHVRELFPGVLPCVTHTTVLSVSQRVDCALPSYRVLQPCCAELCQLSCLAQNYLCCLSPTYPKTFGDFCGYAQENIPHARWQVRIMQGFDRVRG